MLKSTLRFLTRPFLFPWMWVYGWFAINSSVVYFILQENSNTDNLAPVYGNNIGITPFWMLVGIAMVILYSLEYVLHSEFKKLTRVLVMSTAFILLIHTIYILPYVGGIFDL